MAVRQLCPELLLLCRFSMYNGLYKQFYEELLMTWPTYWKLTVWLTRRPVCKPKG